MTLSPSKFSALDWTDFNNEYGIIAGGLGDGAITLWDARKVIEAYSASGNNAADLKMGRGCVSAANIHNGVPVNSIEFNPHKKNLLASGGAEVLIQDISHNIKQSNVFKPGVPNYHQGSKITSISWNRVVSHILASASENGKIVVWDLKVNKSIFTFTEPQSQTTAAGGAEDYFDYFSGSGMDQQDAAKRQQKQQPRETSIVWNPEIPTQFLVANDDDQNPSLNIWDLRNPDYPVATFQDIHYNGVLSVSWSQSDPNLLISSAKDYRTVVLNSKTGEPILEFPTQQQFKKIVWSQPLKGKIAGMDSEGNTQILSLQPEGLYTSPNRPFATPQPSATTNAIYAPKYLQPGCGVRFGFGNKLVTFGGSNGPLIKVFHKQTSANLAQRIQAFDQAIETMDLNKLLDQKIQDSENEIDKLEFTVMKCINKNKYDDLLKMFGFDKTKVVQEVEKYLGRKLLIKKEDAPQTLTQQPPVIKQEFSTMTAESAADFFSELGSRSQAGATQSNQQTSNNNNNEEQKIGGEAEEGGQIREKQMTFVTETVSKNTNWDEGVEGIIKRNLLIGNLEYAAEVALKAGRTTEALLIAEAGGEKLFEKIKEEYFLNSKDSYIKLFLRSIVSDDFKELVSAQALHHKTSNWKESLAYILSYLDGDELKGLVKELADEMLQKKKDINSAIICYMIAQQMETVIDLWKKRTLFYIKKGLDRNEALFQLFEKCILFKTVCKSTKALQDLDLILADMAEYIAHEDLRMLALKYLELSNPRQANVAIIKDRIFNSDSTKMTLKHFAKPQIPYQIEKIKVHMSIFTRQQQNVRQGGMKQNPLQDQSQHRGSHQQQVMGGPQQIRQPPFDQQKKTINQFGELPYQNVAQQSIALVQQQTKQQQIKQRPTIGMQDPTLVANFGYNESNKVPIQQTAPIQQQIGGRQPLINPQQQHQTFPPHDPQQFKGQIPQQIRGQPPLIIGQQDHSARPKIFNPTEMAKQQQELKEIVPPPGGKFHTQTQPQPRQIRPPPMGGIGGGIRPPGGLPPQGNIDQGRPTSSQQHQRMPPPPGGMTQQLGNQMTPTRQEQIQPPIQQVHDIQPQQQFGGQPPIGQPPMIRPRGVPPPGGNMIRPPIMGPGANQQMGGPPGGHSSIGGPRPGMVRPQQQQQQQQMMAGSGGSADASSQEVILSLTNLFNVYSQVELNQKMKQETESKYVLLKERLQEGSINQPLVGLLKGITTAVEANNFTGAMNLHKELIQKNWQESKDWANALKVLITFKQRFTS